MDAFGRWLRSVIWSTIEARCRNKEKNLGHELNDGNVANWRQIGHGLSDP
ncbi:MAG: hypothetical protein ABSH34_09175 [Verrucomicrobiota bacterium]|jgi:hypothetical protein